MADQKNTLLAIILSVIVLVGWQYFFAVPQLEKQKQIQQQQQQQQTKQGPQGPQAPATGPQTPATGPQTPPAQQTQVPTAPSTAPAAPAVATRAQVLANSGPRVQIETPRLRGSISLKGARIDDLSLNDYHETVDPKSPNIVLLAPSGSPQPFYAEFGWVIVDSKIKVPTSETVWTRDGGSTGALTPDNPLKLVWNNGEGVTFRRTITVDRQYMFKVVDAVENKTQETLRLHPYGLVSRHGTPQVLGYYILHEGLIGVLGENKLHEIQYSSIADKPAQNIRSTGGWLGITDKYWAAALVPPQNAEFNARFSSGSIATVKTYQSDFLLNAITVAPNANAETSAQLFAGAKEVKVVDAYEKSDKIKSFELMIDWGWFYFITKPLFQLLDYFYRLLGNFGYSILIVTVLIKIAFFWFANKSYASMAKMKMVQPMMEEIRKRYADDKTAQQQALMELYKKEKINPLAGCWPILIQIPVFFALYKVLFVTIEMRHAPFIGWIRDLSAPDPTNLFNLFGLLPFDPTLIPVFGQFLHVGVWPIVMGITMWVQMKMNPSPPDPTQKMIFDWMPIIFTFLLASFSAGLVIYWAWNNFLSVLQQGVIMKRNGAKIELWDNMRGLFPAKKKADS